VFEITPKEQLLKNVRKGLVQPLPNKYPLLNFDKNIVKPLLLRNDESFIKTWVEQGFYFAVYNGPFDLLQQIQSIVQNYQVEMPVIDDKTLKELCIENKIPFNDVNLPSKTVCCGFSKLEVSTNTLYFSSELQPIRLFQNTDNLILYGKSNQIDSPENNKYFSELMVKNDLKICLPIKYFANFKKVFLLIEEV
jgi:hypothetical protein